MEDATRLCKTCGLALPTTDFYRNGKGVLCGSCKTCTNQRRRKPVLGLSGHPCARCGKPCPPHKQPSRTRRFCCSNCATRFHVDRANRRHRFAQYGITEADHDAMLAAQGGVCAVCGTDDPVSRSGAWHIDHCHDTGKVRGLLCTRCNIGIGQMMDDPARLRAAADYLERVLAPAGRADEMQYV